MLLIGVSASGAYGQSDDELSRSTLRGIGAVYVLVESLPDGAKVLGLTRESIQTDVELKLRLAGMRIVTEQESHKAPGGPVLYVQVGMTNNGLASFTDVALRQDVTLQRNGMPAVFVATWNASVIAMNQDDKEIRNTVKDLVDQFLNAWLSVNPKK
jgi:hypothetical protein